MKLRALLVVPAFLLAAACADAPLSPERAAPGRPLMNGGTTSVSVGGDSYAYDAWATVTATVTPSGSYWYDWEYQYCFNGYQPDDCDYQWRPFQSGAGLTSVQKWIGRGECWSKLRVTVRASSGGTVLATSGEHTVWGAGEWVGLPQYYKDCY